MPRRIILDDTGRVVREGEIPNSDTASFANRDPNTSEADILGGTDDSLVWGTTISVDDTAHSFKEFLRHFTLKYRMYRDGFSDAEVSETPMSETKTYWETLETMLLLGQSRLYLDIRDLHSYPPTRKLWHQVQVYPQEIIPILDQACKDCMMELANAEDQRNRASQSTYGPQASQQSRQSSEPVFPSSDRPEEPPTPGPEGQLQSLEDQVATTTYYVRPYGMDKSTNMRDLNPSGK
jgi:DNA replication licensing factor MCM4